MYDKWEVMYKEKLKTPEEAVMCLKNGDRVVIPTGNGNPRIFWHHVAKRIANGELPDLEIFTGFNLNAPDLCKPEVASKFKYHDGYISPFSRPMANHRGG